jgi:riboflavin kinase/FMN adenylyltransferase
VSSAVAVGVFDGLHLGHRQILASALDRARARHGRCVVVSFDPHPDVVLSPSFRPTPPLTPHAERRALLTAMGVEIYEVVPFTRELAALEPEDFVDRYLIQPFAMRDLVVGENFALGRGRSGNVERLRQIGALRGFEVEAVPLYELDGVPVSSTRIRALLAEGRVAEVTGPLGRRYRLVGVVVTGDGIGRDLGCPTANLRLHEEKLLPADGIYAAWARVGGDTVWHPAALSIGMRPTFGDQPRAIEVHLIDWEGELVGRELEVELETWVRGQLKFDTPEALAAAIQDDLRAVRGRLDAASAPA